MDKKKIIKYGQFPYGRRKVQYQGLPGMPGIRDMKHRYKVMKIPKDFTGKTVLDIGCSLGAICVESLNRGAVRAVGLDYKEETINIAKETFPQVEYYQFQINNGLEKLKNLIGEDSFDYVFALSIWNHVDKNKLFEIIRFYTKGWCWFEGHKNQKSEKFIPKFKKLGIKKSKFLGYTTDRNQRANFKLWF